MGHVFCYMGKLRLSAYHIPGPNTTVRMIMNGLIEKYKVQHRVNWGLE